MASILGINRRKAEAQARIEAVVPRLADHLGLEVAPMPTYRRDAAREGADRAEWIADVLERMATAVGVDVLDAAPSEPEPAVDSETEAPQRPALSSLKRAELNALAAELGIADADQLPNADLVQEAIEARWAEIDAASEPEAADAGGDEDSEDA